MNQLDPNVMRDLYGEPEVAVNPMPQARKLNPQDVARGVEIQKKTGVDAILAAQRLPEFQDELDQDYWNRMVKESPKTAKFMAASPVNAALLQKDADSGNLGMLEAAFKPIVAAAKYLTSAPDTKNTLMGDLAGGWYKGNASLYGVLRAGAELAAPVMDPLAGTILPENPLRRVAAGAGNQAKQLNAIGNAYSPPAAGIVQGGVSAGVQSAVGFGKYAPLLALGPAGGGAALAGMVSETFGSSYTQARDKGLAPIPATTFAVPQAVIEYATEKIPMSKLIGDIASNATLRQTLVQQLKTEIPGEQVATILQDLNEWAALNPEKPFKEYLAERPSAAAQTLIATAVGVGGNVALSRAVGGVMDKSGVVEARAQEAQQHAQLFEDIQKTAAATEVLGTNAETLTAYMQDLADEGVPQVYVDSTKLVEAGVDLAKLAQTVPSIAAQLEQIETGGDLVIPTGELLAATVGTEFAQPLIDNARTDVNGMSRAEAQVYMQEKGDQVNAEIAQVLAAEEQDAEFKAGRDEVQAEILTQLNEVKRFTPKVNENYALLTANFYAVMAARSGMTVRQFADTYKLGFAANTAQGSAVMNQAKAEGYAGADQNEANEWLVAKAKGLDMSHEGRMARAQSLGFDTSKVYFHSTLSDTREFAPTGSFMGHTGTSGISVTDNPEMASRYLERFGNTRWDGTLFEKNVIPVFIRPGKVLERNEPFRSDLRLGAPLPAGYVPEHKKLGFDTLVRDDAISRKGNVKHSDAKNAIRGKELVLTDPSQIRSVFAAFDPDKKDSANILNQALAPADIAQSAINNVATGDLVAQHNLTAENLLHAVKMGGIAVPSLAVTNKAHPLTNFGEITLVAPSDMVDPKGYAAAKVFGADIYSPRYPSITLELTPAMKKTGEAMLEKGKAATDTRYIDWSEVERDGARELERQQAVMWQFLDSKGIEPTVVRTAPKPLPEQLQAFADDTRPNYELAADPAFIEAAWATYEAMLVKAYDGDAAAAKAEVDDTRKRAEQRGVSQTVNGYAQDIQTYRNEVRQSGKVDTWKTKNAMDEQIRSAGLTDEFRDYVKNLLGSIKPNERIFQGFTPSGNRKYVPHTLENVVKILKKELRGGENFNYGVGSLRAKFTPQFKSIDQIRKAKNRLMDKAGFEKIKTEVDAELVAISEELDLSLEQTIEVMEDTAKLGATRAIQRAMADYRDGATPPDDAAQRVAEYLTKLKNLPTEYFEAKILRDVDLAEFKGAVVPEGVNPEVIKALNARGVTDIRTYKKGDDADRAAKIGEFGNLFFQEARGQIAFGKDITQQASIISLLKGADLSTFIHEGGHFFLEVQTDLANRITARIAAGEQVSVGERSILDDMNSALRWMGVTGDQDLSALDQWALMGVEEKRPHHEKWARGFEAYAFEGKSPSLELAKMFQTFRAWLVNVYRNLKKMVDGASDKAIAESLDVELTDEVRAVMDRMLATTEQIQEAEAARAMGPLFQTPEQGGMTLDEFKAYHDQGTQATQDAIQELQGKGLRDMQWLRNARSRKLKELQKQHNALRKRIEADVRADVLSQPLYRAWTFLTSKQVDKVEGAKPVGNAKGINPEVDNLFTAIAKLGGLDRAQVKSQWGIDEKEKLDSGVFGAPVVRKTDGLSLDAMAERLVEYGYMLPDENGSADLAKFEELFDDQRRGTDRYSIQRDMAAAYGDAPLNLPDLPEVGFGKLRTDDLRRRYGSDDTAIWRKLSKLRMTSDEIGMDADVVAELFGFSSGDELVRALADAEPPKSVIEGMTDQRMLEEHGDLATPAGLERAADAAIHNEARVKFVATELAALQKASTVREKVPGKRHTVDVLAKLAKNYATEIIARLKVREVRPHQYAAAEARAARAAIKATGDLEKQTLHKRNQLINLYATRAAYQAQDDVAKALEYFKKFDKTSPALDADYADQIHALLERFDLRKATSLKAIDKRKSLVQWVESQREQGLEPDIPDGLLQEAYRKSIKDMTVEEVRGLYDTVRQIEHLGRLKGKLLTAQENRDFAAAVDEITTSIDENAKGRTADTRTPNTLPALALQSLKNFWASHIKVATWARVMDGGKDGGAVWEYLIRNANVAGDTEVVMREKAAKELAKLVAPVLKEGEMGGKGQYFPSIQRSLNKEARLAIALNVGNDGNTQRLLGGEGWTIDQIRPVLDSLSAADWQFVQAVWDHFETYRPQIAAKERRIYGKEPNWVEPVQVQTKFGVLRGGYYPVKYDTRASVRAEEHADAEAARQQLKGAYTSATTRRSFTKARAEEVNGRPLLYSLDGIYNGVQEVIHDLTWHEWLIDTNKLLKNKAVDGAIRNAYGPDVVRQFKSWVEDNATGDRGAQNAGELAAAWLRQGVSVSGLGLNVMSALMQPLGITQSIVRIGPKWVGKGIAQAIGSPLETADAINEKSEFMRTRALTRLREIAEVRSQVKGQTKTRRAIDSSAYFLMMRAQQLVDIPTWWGAYEKATAEGNDENRAVALADQAVIDAQGSGTTKDLSAIERGGPVSKLFTVFYSFFNTALNLGVGRTMTAENKAKLAADYILLFTVPAILGALLKDAMTAGDSGDWDDPESILKKLAGEQLSFLMGLMVGVREFTAAAQALTGTQQYAGGYQGPAGVRMIVDAYKLALQTKQGEMDDGLRKSVVNAAGDLLRLPAAQINRTITGAQALADGKTENPGVLLTGYQEP